MPSPTLPSASSAHSSLRTDSNNSATGTPATGVTTVRLPRSRYVVFAAITVVGCAVDLATKSWAFDRLGSQTGKAIWIVPDILSLETSLNRGALFGIGQAHTTVFAGLSVVAGMFIVYWLFIARAAYDGLLTAALGSVSGGILGNLYDRLGFPGLTWRFPVEDRGERVFAVRDWIHFQIYDVFDWPVFNIADCLLVCGAGLLLVRVFRPYGGEPGESA